LQATHLSQTRLSSHEEDTWNDRPYQTQPT
jgi:hypothetical protein